MNLPHQHNILAFFAKHRRLTLCLAVVFGVLIFLQLILPSKLFRSPTSTVIFDRSGELLFAKVASDGQWRFAEIDSVPYKYATCLIHFEDRRFRYHLGVDPIAIVRALLSDIRHARKAQGASTLNMQLARMARGNKSRNVFHKVIETCWAFAIDLRYSKDQVLALYASHAPMGGNVVGLPAAAWRYFGRSADQLTWAESATLAVLPNSPTLINVGRNRQLLAEKRNRLLTSMANSGIIDSLELAMALAEELPERPFAMQVEGSHLLSRIALTDGGKSVLTTVDSHLQHRVQQIADRHCRALRVNHIENLAVLVADVRSGQVLAYVGNTSMNDADCRHVDMIAAERSTGSLLKPFLYAAMLTDGEQTPFGIVQDTPLDINGFSPRNYSRTYSGAVGADAAIRQSLNVPLVRMLTAHNAARFIDNLHWLGMSTIRHDENHYGSSLILGGAEGTLWDMTGMYASLARLADANNYETADRQLVRSLYVVKDHKPSLFAKTNSGKLSRSAAWYALEAMTGLNRPEEESDWQQFKTMKRIAWKTGTSFGNRDAWAIGLTPEYIVGTWVGNATGEGRAEMTGIGAAAPLMFDVFGSLTTSSQDWFPMPLEDTDPIAVCRRSGWRASPTCDAVDTLLLPRHCEDAATCRYCRLVHLSSDGRWRVNSSCVSPSDMITKSWFVLSPAMDYYYRRCHADYAPLPPLHPDCSAQSSPTLEFIYPEHKQIIVLPRNFEGQQEKMVCHVASSLGRRLFWHLDDEYLCQTEEKHFVAIAPSIGSHRLLVVSEDGETASVTFEVK